MYGKPKNIKFVININEFRIGAFHHKPDISYIKRVLYRRAIQSVNKKKIEEIIAWLLNINNPE